MNPGSEIFESHMILHVAIGNSQENLTIRIVKDIIIGRQDTRSQEKPDLDLGPYGAYRLGVSRRHALIHADENGLILNDLGSRNGTFCNEQQITPDHPQRLQNGDVIRLGNITLRITFHEA